MHAGKPVSNVSSLPEEMHAPVPRGESRMIHPPRYAHLLPNATPTRWTPSPPYSPPSPPLASWQAPPPLVHDTPAVEHAPPRVRHREVDDALPA
jgi:hypothetical protein